MWVKVVQQLRLLMAEVVQAVLPAQIMEVPVVVEVRYKLLRALIILPQLEAVVVVLIILLTMVVVEDI